MLCNGSGADPDQSEFAQAPSGTIPTRNEQIIHGAVARGNAQYWADSRRQEEAFKEWEAAGYEGDCRQCSNGSVVDYITRAIMSLSEPAKKMLEGASSVPSTPGEPAQAETEPFVHIDNVVYHLDDVEVDKAGRCTWADVANALTHIRLCVERRTSPVPSTDPGGK